MSTENTIRIKGSITGEVISVKGEISGGIEGALEKIKGRISSGNAAIPSYTGSYAVQPDSVGKKKKKKNKRMIDNVIINPIRFAETSNEFGTTVYIGE